MNLNTKRQYRTLRAMSLALLLTYCTVGLSACDSCTEKKGPLERTGEKVDEKVNDAKRAVEDAAD